MNAPRILTLLIILLAVAFLEGCGSTFKRNPVPRDLVATAQIDGLESWRLVGDQVASRDDENFRLQADRFARQLGLITPRTKKIP